MKRPLNKVGISYPVFFACVGSLFGMFFLSYRKEITVIVQLVLLFYFFAMSLKLKFSVVLRYHVTALQLACIGMSLSSVLIYFLIKLIFPTTPWETALILAVLLSITDESILSYLTIESFIPPRLKQILSIESSVTTLLGFVFLIFFIPKQTFSLSYLFPYVLGPLFIGIFFALMLGMALKRINSQTSLFLTISFLSFGYFLFNDVFSFLLFAVGMSFILGNFFRVYSVKVIRWGKGNLHYLFATVFFFIPMLGFRYLLNIEVILFSFLLIFVIRPLISGISLSGRGYKFSSLCFLGLFGPKGLPTLSLGWLLFRGDEIFSLIFYPCFFSILFHGILSSRFFLNKVSGSLMGDVELSPTVELPYVGLR